MAARSAAKRDAVRRFQNPKLLFGFALIVAESILVALIIAYVPCKYQQSTLHLNFISSSVLWISLNYVVIHWFQIQRLIGMLICLRFESNFASSFDF